MRVQILINLALLIGIAKSAENKVTINVKNAVNFISDRFISYEIAFPDMLNFYRDQNSLKNLSVISPAYIKLRGFSSYLKNAANKKLNEDDVAKLMETLNSLQIVPVVVIDYNSEKFEPINLLQELKTARNLKIRNCVWQLGENELDLDDNKNLKRYNDDLKTLKILCESAKREHHLNWDVAAVGGSLKTHAEKLPFDVVGYDLKTLATDEILSKSSPSLPKTQAPLWVNIENSSTEITEPKALRKGSTCNHECLINGLLYAQVLGTAAKKGLDVLFFDETLNNSTLTSSDVDFKKAVTLLHKKLIGSKAFNVRVSKTSSDGKLSNLFSHCSNKNDGSLTLMGINFSNMRSKFNVKISSPTDANAMILQYLLSASDGHVLLNNEKFSVDLPPSYKYKKHSKFSISLVLPPFSMAFWTVKNVKVDECLNLQDGNKINLVKDSQLTSTDKLLKKLVDSEFNGRKSNVIEKSRSKRQIGDGITGQFLPSTFDFELPTFKLPSLMMTSATNHKPIRNVLFNKNTDVFKAAPTDVNPPQMKENPLLPTGDVYMTVDDGTSNFDGSLKVVVDDEPKRHRESRKKGNNKIVFRETTEEAPEYFIPHDYLDAAEKATKPRKSSKKVEQPREIGELFEVEHPMGAVGRGGDQTRSASHNVELKTVIRELEPTYRQSKTALKAAKKKWDRGQILELLKDAQIDEKDRSRLEEADDIEVIDYTEHGESPNYEEYEEDDDGFFDEDRVHRVRTKRDLSCAKNEIPKYGFHDTIDEDEDDSIESLMDDVHLYVPPQILRDTESNSDSAQMNAPISSANNPPITVKAINFFSKSLNQAVDVLDKTLVGWWYVFNPRTTILE